MNTKIELYIIKVKHGAYYSYHTAFCIVLTQRKDNAALLNYKDACDIAFDMNKQQGSLDYATIERVI